VHTLLNRKVMTKHRKEGRKKERKEIMKDGRNYERRD
jgi:hypothetical protein